MEKTPKKKKNNNLLYAGIALVGVSLVAAASTSTSSGKPVKQIGGETFADPAPTKPATGNSNPTPTTKALNRDLILKAGSKGEEVKELQRLLKISVDGVFGTVDTEPALFKLKGVKQISLNGFAKAPNVNQNPLKVGDRLMSNNLNGTKVYSAIKKADGTYYTNWDLFRTIPYGGEVGKLKGYDASKTNYSIFFTYGDLVCFIKAVDVKKY